MSEYDYGDKGEWTDQEKISLLTQKLKSARKQIITLKEENLKLHGDSEANRIGHEILTSAIKRERNKNKFCFLWEVLTNRNTLIRF